MGAAPDAQLDLAYFRDLVKLCVDGGVAGFSYGGLQMTFHEKTEQEPWSPRVAQAIKNDDGHSTSPRQVGGFVAERRDGFKHPSLWQGQNGKTLRFDGTLD